MEGLNDKYMKMYRNRARRFQKKYWQLALLLLWIGCGKNDMERNPYLPELRFNVPINLNLPQYDNLRYTGGHLFLPQYGHKGLLLFRLNPSTVMAWEASCPNHLPSDCSRTTIVSLLAECSCEGYQYDLATGQLFNPPADAATIYPLVNYRAEERGGTLYVSN